MNRRDFLKTLAAFGTTVAIPLEAIAEAPEELIEQAWQAALANPTLFYVNEYQTITAYIEKEWPGSRGELYGIEAPGDIDALKAIADAGRVSWFIDDALLEAEVETLEALDEDALHDLLHQVSRWVLGDPDEWDAENATRTGNNAQGEALLFFRGFEYSDDLDIVIVEGDSPGSSYFAAELRSDVDDANERAEALGLPIRFVFAEA